MDSKKTVALRVIFEKIILWTSCLVCVFIIFWHQCMAELGSAFSNKESFFTDEDLFWYQYTFVLGIVMAIFKINKIELLLLLIILGFVPCCFSGLFFLGAFEKGIADLLAIGYILTFALVPAIPVVLRYIIGVRISSSNAYWEEKNK